MHFEIKTVREHVEVYDMQGRFVFSADSYREAMQELHALEADAA